MINWLEFSIPQPCKMDHAIYRNICLGNLRSGVASFFGKLNRSGDITLQMYKNGKTKNYIITYHKKPLP